MAGLLGSVFSGQVNVLYLSAGAGFILFFAVYLCKRYLFTKQQVWNFPYEQHYFPVFNEKGVEEQRKFSTEYKCSDPVTMSIVVPAYNEEARLPAMLDETIAYMKQRQEKDNSFTFEIVIVDDGSKDRTYEVALGFVKRGYDFIRVLKLRQNRGKGGAIRRGMMVARGKYMLMADADGASSINDVVKLEEALDEVSQASDHGIAIGSRYHLVGDKESPSVMRNAARLLISKVFHLMVEVLCVSSIRDTQCGFKLFTRKTVHLLFPNLHVERWAFDVELLFLAQLNRIPMKEVAINWHEVDGSKLDPVAASIQMFKDILRIRACYLLGIWSLRQPTLS